MLKTYFEQAKKLALSKCKHFNGVQNCACKAGVEYQNVRQDRPFGIPCFVEDGITDFCPLFELHSDQEAFDIALQAEAKIEQLLAQRGDRDA